MVSTLPDEPKLPITGEAEFLAAPPASPSLLQPGRGRADDGVSATRRAGALHRVVHRLIRD